MAEIKRQIAYKCGVRQILQGKYVQEQGISPDYLSFCGLKVSRVNLIAVLVSKEGNVLTLDDGTGQIQVMLFEERLKSEKYVLGSLVLIIGRPREHDQKRFLVPEIIKRLENKKWIEHRKLELSVLDYCKVIEDKKEKISKEIMESNTDNYQEKIINRIKELDKGEGAPYQELIKILNMQDAEKKVEELIKDGEIFEVKGKIKLL